MPKLEDHPAPHFDEAQPYEAPKARVKFLRRADVETMTGIPRATIYEMVNKGRFPRPVHITPRIVCWVEAEVAAWQASRIAERDAHL